MHWRSVDTVDAAFQLWLNDPSFVLPPCGAVLLDEVGSLGSTRFEHVMATWQRSDLGCPLVFFGDFGQL